MFHINFVQDNGLLLILYLISHHCKVLPKAILKSLVESLVKSLLNYALPVWGPALAND